MIAHNGRLSCSADQVVTQQWAVCGLPNDNLSVGNGIIIATARLDWHAQVFSVAFDRIHVFA